MNDPKDVTALISQLAEAQRQVWLMIAVAKQVAHALPPKERLALLKQAMEAESKVSGVVR